MVNLYILEVSPDKKEMSVVISERKLLNLAPLPFKLLAILRKIFPHYRVYQYDEKYFKDADNKEDWFDPMELDS